MECEVEHTGLAVAENDLEVEIRCGAHNDVHGDDRRPGSAPDADERKEGMGMETQNHRLVFVRAALAFSDLIGSLN